MSTSILDASIPLLLRGIKKDASMIAIVIPTCVYVELRNGEGTGSKSRYEAHRVAACCDSYTSHPSSFRGGIYQRHHSRER